MLKVDAQKPRRHGSRGFSQDRSLQFHLLVRVLAWTALTAGLVLPTIAPATANIAVIALMVLAVPLCWRSPWRAILRQPGVLLPLLGGIVLLLAFAITARSAMHLVAVLYFAPLYLVGPLVALFDRLRARDMPAVIGGLAFAGSVGAAAVACYDAFALGLPRAGISVNNPIHFADLALMLGFVSLTGLFGRLGRVRMIFVLGPVLAMVAVILSGSRGPMLASAALLITVLVLWLFWRLPRRHAWLAAGGGAVAVVAVLAVLLQTGLVHHVAALGDIATLLQTGAAPDSSTSQRLIMYQSAYDAFLASPIYGHGLIDFIAITAGYAPQGVVFPAYEHLHNDIADFSVVGGIMGLCAYAMFIAAPLASGLRAAHNRRAALMLGATLSIGYLTMGLTNAMLGVLSQTVLFSVGTALVVHLGRTGAVEEPA